MTTTESLPLDLALSAVDVDSPALTYTTVISPLHGTLSGALPILTYTPDDRYAGPDVLTFRANDGRAYSNIGVISITVEAVPAPVLTLSKTDGRASAEPGQTLEYTLTVSNTGVGPALGLVLTDTLPLHASFIAASGGGVPSNGSVTWSIGSLEVAEILTRTVTIQVANVLPAGAEVITNTAQVSDAKGYSATTQDVDALLANPVLGLNKDDGVLLVRPGDILTYTLAISNTGNQAAANVVLTDALPEDAVFVAASAGSTVSGDGVTWGLGTLEANALVTQTVTVQVPRALPVSVQAITNSAEARGDESPVVKAEDVDRVVAVDLSLRKDDHRSVADAGAVITYTLTISHTGGGAVSGVAVSDTLPAYTGFVDASEGGAYVESSRTVTWPSFGLAAGMEVSRTVTVRIDEAIPTSVRQITNTATVLDNVVGTAELNLDNNSGTDVDAINHPPVAEDDVAATDEDTPITVAVLTNDSDPEGSALIIVQVGEPANGVAVLNPDQSISYTPAVGFGGIDAFTYVVSDGALSDSASVRVIVAAVPDVAVAVALRANTKPEGLELRWSHIAPNARYELWRSSSPYSAPGDSSATPLAELTPPSSGSDLSYTDGDASAAGGSYYVVKALSTSGHASALSNRVGRFTYILSP